MNKNLDAIVLRYLGYAILFIIALELLYLVRAVLPIFGVALLFAYALEPLLRVLETRGYSRGGAVAYVAIIFVLLFVAGITLMASAWQQAQALAAEFPTYQSRLIQLLNENRYRLEEARLPDNVKKSLLEGIGDFQNRALGNASSYVTNGASWVIASLGTIGIVCVVVPILTLYFMLEMNSLRGRTLMIVPALYRRDVTEIGNSINEMLGRYVRGQMIVCSLFGLLCTIGFHALSFKYGMQYPLVLGIAAGFIYIVPYLGMASIAVAAAATGYFTASSSPVQCAIIAVSCCVVFNLIIDYVVAPRVLGRGVGLHPLMVIFALLSGAQIGGIIGMILAVPVVASLRVVAIYLFPQLVAPLPDTPPEGQPENKDQTPAQIADEVVQQAASAAAKAPSRLAIFNFFRRNRHQSTLDTTTKE
jgi:predicted PurR-regulated permease PerM